LIAALNVSRRPGGSPKGPSSFSLRRSRVTFAPDGVVATDESKQMCSRTKAGDWQLYAVSTPNDVRDER
jgi:hypothetical protein